MKSLFTTKKSLSRLFFLIYFMSSVFLDLKGQYTCCPKFKLETPELCADSTACRSTTPNAPIAKACKGTNTKYTILPNIPGYTYAWTVTGGTPTAPTGNPMTVNWGSGSSGFIKVIITGPGGTCKDSIQMSFCLVDAPKANFTMPDSSCVSMPVTYMNTSIGGNNYLWDFGDGNVYAGSNPNPSHSYTNPGIYIVCLTVSNVATGNSAGGKCVGCSDFICDTIKINAGAGPEIHLVGCKGSFCASSGDTTRFGTSSSCTPLTWSIPAGAGTILNPGGNPVQIIWNPAFVGQPAVTLSVPATCTGGCPATTTLIAPIIFPTLPITGPDPVCVGSINTYSIPVLPGSYYSATLTNIGALSSWASSTNTFNSNHVDVNAGPISGQYILQFTYYDSLKHCGGIARDTITVKPKFKISPPAGPICDNTPYSLCANGTANWTVDSLGITIATFSGVSCIPLLSFNPGIYSITAIPSPASPWCNSSDATTVQILPNPILTTLNKINDTVCKGDIKLYNVSSTVPSSPFVWSITGGSIVANDDSMVTVKWTSPGTLTVKQISPCLSNTITFTVDTFLAPSISGPSTACEDDTVVYTVTPTNLPSYTFSALYGSILSQSGNTVTVIWAGRPGGGHQISVTTCSGTAVLNVSVQTAAPNTVTVGTYGCNSVSVSSSVAGAAPYAWYLNGVLQGGLTTQSITVSSNGYWYCKPTGCYKKSGANVLFPAPPILNITTPVNLFCRPSSGSAPVITFYSALSMGTPSSYQWYGPATNYASPTSLGAAGTSATFTPTGSTTLGSYYCIVTYGAGCTVTSNTINIDTACATASGTCTTPPYSVTSISSTCSGGGKIFTANMSSVPPGGTSYSWTFGDGGTGSGATATHTYSLPGVYQVCVTVTNASYCTIIACRYDTVTFVPNFVIKRMCNGDSLINTTQLLAGFSISSFAWSASGGANMVSATNVNPGFANGNGNITLTVTVGGCANTITQAITTPSSSVAISGLPTRICKNSILSGITTIPGPLSFSSDSWNFGDGTTSNICPTSHAWTSSGTFTITINTIDLIGCPASGSASIIIDTLPTVTLFKDTMICKGSFVNLYASPTFLSSYLWYTSTGVSLGTPNTIPRPFSTTGMYYVIGVDGNGCRGISNTVSVIVKPLPKIKFNFPNGQTVCMNGSGGGVNIGTPFNIKYTYSWSSDDPTNISFLPPNVNSTYVSVSPGATLGFHQLYLTVVDTSTGCSKTDTVCIFVQNRPNVTIAPGGPICEGPPSVTLTPTPNNPALYSYLWSTGATTSTISVSTPGQYSVSIDSMGCSNLSNTVIVNPKPNLELFPKGCDTMCDTAHLYIPLANIIGYPPPPGDYPTITWLIDNTTLIPGPYLYLSSISLGSHNIQVIVINSYGCTDTSNVYNVFVRNCDSFCPPCIKDSCCNDFLDSLKNKFIGVNYASSPIITFTPPTGLLATDIVQWDFNCDGIVDMTTMGNATATYNYFTTGTYYACIKIIRTINTPTQRDTCYANFTKKIIIEKQDHNDPCDYCNNLMANIYITDDCAIAGDRYRTAFATGGSGVYTYKWINPITNTVVGTSNTYSGASPCYCVIKDQVTGCFDTSSLDYYNDISTCIANTTADNRCTNFKLTITKADGPSIGDVILTGYGGGGSGNYWYFYYGKDGVTNLPITVGPTTAPSITTSALTSANTFMKVHDITYGCEAIDTFRLVDKTCYPASIFGNSAKEIKVYPIPTSHTIHIETIAGYKLNNSSIRIMDLMGRTIHELEWKASNSAMEINLEAFDMGIYYLNITNKNGDIIHYQKIIKQ